MSAEGWATEGAVQMLRVMWAEGQSATQVAQKLATIGVKVTRSAVLGKVHRLGLLGRTAASSRPPARIPHAPWARHRPPVQNVSSPPSGAIAGHPGKLRDPPKRDPDSKTQVRFLDLRAGQCKMFCAGEEGPDGFVCGAPTQGGPWCSVCRSLCYRPAESRRVA